MKREKDRAKAIHKVFFFVDIFLMVIISCLLGFLVYTARPENDDKSYMLANLMITVVPSILEVVFSLVLFISAW